MSHRHDHAGHSHGHGHVHAGSASQRRLKIALALLFSFTVIEAAGGVLANSLALLAEAVHMLADSAALLLAILAIRVARRPASPQHTYGHHRYQTLAAFVNGLALLLLTVWVVVEAVLRLIHPPQVDARLMLGVAVLGGIANLSAFVALSGASSLNERGARAHVLSDLLGSGAAALAAVAILIFRWMPMDPLLSLGVSALILRSGWQLTRESAHVLLEGTPLDFELDRVENELTQVPGVLGVHHVHAWSLTGEGTMLTLHAELGDGVDRNAALAAILGRLRDRLGVAHATVQIEERGCLEPDAAHDCH